MRLHPVSRGYLLKDWLLYFVWGGEANLVNAGVKQKPLFDANPTANGHDVYKRKYPSSFECYIIWIFENTVTVTFA